MTILGKKYPLIIEPFVNPSDDSTALDTMFFTDADKVRFDGGKLRKIKGWTRIFSNNEQRIIGAARNIFSYRDADNTPWTLIGTHRSLYALKNNSDFFNITPISTATTATPLCFTTEYNTGVNIPVTTVAGSDTVTLSVNQYLNSGDEIQISGVIADINGIPASEFNNTFPTTVIDNNTIQISITTPATSSGTVLASMDWATGYLYVDIDTGGNPLLKGDRIKFSGSTDVGNIGTSLINAEQVISNVVNSIRFVFQTQTIATSLVENGGGSDVLFQRQIAAGNIDQNNGFGYGGNNYGGVGLPYGSALQYTNQAANTGPRIWSMDKWQNSSNVEYIILTPGDLDGSADETGANLYSWTNDLTVAPVLIADAPIFVKWTYVSNNVICTLGGAFSPASQGIPNFFASSDVGDMTAWTPGPSSYAFRAVLDAAGPLISQASTRNRDLLFTENEVYLAQFVDKPKVWVINKLMTTDGIMGPKARVEIEDAVLWMGKGDFFVFDGTSVDVLPNNTMQRNVFDNISETNYLKCFAHSVPNYNEVWFFWVKDADTLFYGDNTPGPDGTEPNNYAMYNYQDKTWCMGTMLRTASEEPFNVNETPYMIESNFTKTLNPSSVKSYFFALSPSPLLTANGSQFIDVLIPGNDCYLKAGDYVSINGAMDTNGIPAGEINGIKQIVSTVNLGENGYVTIESTTPAISSGTGGGDSVTLGTAILGFDIGSTRIGANESIGTNLVPAVGGIPVDMTNVSNATIRYTNGSVIQVDNGSPETVFATNSETITNNISPLFEITYYPSDRLFQHENGLNAYNVDYVYGSDDTEAAPMLSYAKTNMMQLGDGDDTAVLYSIYPDTNQAGNLTLKVTGKLYPQSGIIFPRLGNGTGEYNITPITTKVDLMFVARQRQYTITSNEIDGNFLIGKWYEEVKPSSTR